MDFASLTPVAGAIAGAIIAAIAAIWGVRARAKVDIGTVLNTKFNDLTNQLQEERMELRAEIVSLRSENRALEVTERRMRWHIEDMEARLKRAGLESPPRVGWE